MACNILFNPKIYCQVQIALSMCRLAFHRRFQLTISLYCDYVQSVHSDSPTKAGAALSFMITCLKHLVLPYDSIVLAIRLPDGMCGFERYTLAVCYGEATIR